MLELENLSGLLNQHGVRHQSLSRVEYKENVFTDGRIYVKQHDDVHLFKVEESIYERVHGMTLSIPSELLLITRKLGEHFLPTTACIETMFVELIKFHNLTIEVPQIDLQDRVWQRFASRVQDNSALSDDAKRWVEQCLRQRLPLELASESRGLIHTDPHLGNWVKHDQGIALIDFESVTLGGLAIDVGALIHALLLNEEVALANVVRALYLEYGGSQEALSQGLWLKNSTALTWCAWSLGEQELLRWKNSLIPLSYEWDQTV